MLAVARLGLRCLLCVKAFSPPSFGTAFEVA
jgi:hypothetical protein